MYIILSLKMNKIFHKFLVNTEFSPKNVTYFVAYHTITDNPHFYVG